MAEIIIYTDSVDEWKTLTQKYPNYTIIELSSFVLGVIDDGTEEPQGFNPHA